MSRIFKALTPKPAKPRAAPEPRAQPRATADARPDGAAAPTADARRPADAPDSGDRPKEHGGPDGPEPTRYGDWERGGICYDF